MLFKNYLIKPISIVFLIVFMVQVAIYPYHDIKRSLKNISFKAYNHLSPLLLSPDLMLRILLPAIRNAHADPVAEGKAFGKNQLNLYHPNNISTTLRQTCVQKDAQGNCTKYMVNEQDGMFTDPGQMIPKMQDAATQSGSYTGYVENLPSAQAQGQASHAYSEFTVLSNNECYERNAQGVCIKTKQDMINDMVFGNRCLQYGSDGKCITWGKSKDIMENSYADCVKKITPIYEEPGTIETCEVDPKNMFKTEEKPPCTVQNNPRLTNEVIFTKCSGSVSYRDKQIYGVCKDWYFWHLVYDRTVSWTPGNISECPTTCEQLNGLCSNFPVGYLTTPPSNGEYLGEYYDTFEANAGNPPSVPPSCSYKVYKWYRQYDHSTVERIFLDRTSNCDSAKLDEWIEDCRIKKYEICSAGGGGCVTVANDEQPTGATNKVCRNITGTMRNYILCPNAGGASTGGELEDEPILINDGTGEKEITKTQRNETLKEFAETVIWSMSYGGEGVKGAANDYYAHITFTCDTYTDTPPECQGLVDQGCKFINFKCIDPPETNTNVIPECLKYEYSYRCGQGGKIIGYQVVYECASGLVEGIKCLGTQCADAYYDANKDFMMFATATEILKQIQIDTDITDLNNIRIFPGEHRECQSWPNNCCKKLQGGISVANYVTLGFNLAKMYQFVTTGFAAMSASTAASISKLFGGSMVEHMILAAFDTTVLAEGASISLNLFTGAGGPLDSLGSVVVDLFGTGEVLVTSTTYSGTLSVVSSIMTAVSIIMLVYSLVTFIYELIWRCTQNDVATGVQLGQARCHYTGNRCADRFIGICIKRKNVYCCFSSLLARLIHQQGRPQIGKSWGSPKKPDCSGFTPDELSQLDFGSMDLTEYMQYLEGKYTEQLDQQQQVDYQGGVQGNLPNTQQTIRDRLDQYYQRK